MPEITNHKIITRSNQIVALIATTLHVSQQSMLLTVEPVGSVDGALSNGKDGVLPYKKKSEFILWILIIGKYRA